MFPDLSHKTEANSLPWTPGLPVAARCFVLLAGAGLLALLAVAASLQPSRRGYGTHQQLGLGPCTVLTLWGVRCPTCGMTTSWAYTMRGQLAQAATANCGGMLLALLAIPAAPWLLVSGIRGRWWGGLPNGTVTLTVGLCVVGVTLLDWTVRILTR